MARILRIYRRSLGAHLRAQLEYEADFWILVVAGLLTQTLGIFFFAAVFARVPTLNGWRFEEVVLIYGLAGLTSALIPVLVDGIWGISHQIHYGELDYRLVRPFPPVLQVASNSLGMNGFGDTIGSSALVVWALTRVEVDWSVGTALIAVLLFAGGVGIRIAIALASNAASFWVRAPFPMVADAIYQLGELGRYPVTIYGAPIRLLIGVAIPFAFAGFFPAAWVLGKGGFAWLGLLTPVVAVACLTLAYCIFQRGLRRYESVGH
ncbi:ABC-2 type transport system permease protein [Allocatelliglobosispora scoriae]|uniref:ABC-2 type transport system permease protein n=1 Tax=Allocatelliglobosispora scoriae TaxID=643052 RepID=A0A841BZD1_9ACTN|nr:ABC-2 family transporter protein [Allocatelliglobosispora scoriae]MBB5872263.1 ABC-2 type transport system permease protein [Allocatelliglobosispora scoriae]